jgi:hypothetical protein
MRPPVAVYRGIEIHQSKVVLCLPGQEASPTHGLFEARVDGWLIVGTLECVQEEIDKRIKWDESSGKH